MKQCPKKGMWQVASLILLLACGHSVVMAGDSLQIGDGLTMSIGGTIVDTLGCGDIDGGETQWPVDSTGQSDGGNDRESTRAGCEGKVKPVSQPRQERESK